MTNLGERCRDFKANHDMGYSVDDLHAFVLAEINKCTLHLEAEADLATNSLHCGDNAMTIARTHRDAAALRRCAKIINDLVSSPLTTEKSK